MALDVLYRLAEGDRVLVDLAQEDDALELWGVHPGLYLGSVYQYETTNAHGDVQVSVKLDCGTRVVVREDRVSPMKRTPQRIVTGK